MVHITRGTQKDFLEVARLDHQAWVDAPNAQNIPDGEHVWRIWTEHALLFVAREDNTVLGAIVAFPCISGKWYVHKLFVRADRRRTGIGHRLFRKLLGKVDELGIACFLTVAPQNEKLIEFYRSLGFSLSGLVEGYYRENEHRCILTRDQSGTALIRINDIKEN